MKKEQCVPIAVWVAAVICLVSCFKYEKAASTPNTSVDYNVIVIDGCQYLEMRTYMYSIVTHKGDCTNRIHICQVEQLENPRTGLDGEFAAGVRWGLIAKGVHPEVDNITTLTKAAAYLRFNVTNMIIQQDATSGYLPRWTTNRKENP